MHYSLCRNSIAPQLINCAMVAAAVAPTLASKGRGLISLQGISFAGWREDGARSTFSACRPRRASRASTRACWGACLLVKFARRAGDPRLSELPSSPPTSGDTISVVTCPPPSGIQIIRAGSFRARRHQSWCPVDASSSAHGRQVRSPDQRPTSSKASPIGGNEGRFLNSTAAEVSPKLRSGVVPLLNLLTFGRGGFPGY
jgi:hypothetical protein